MDTSLFESLDGGQTWAFRYKFPLPLQVPDGYTFGTQRVDADRSTRVVPPR